MSRPFTYGAAMAEMPARSTRPMTTPAERPARWFDAATLGSRMGCRCWDWLALARGLSGVLGIGQQPSVGPPPVSTVTVHEYANLQEVRDGPGRNRTCDLGIKSGRQ